MEPLRGSKHDVLMLMIRDPSGQIVIDLLVTTIESMLCDEVFCFFLLSTVMLALTVHNNSQTSNNEKIVSSTYLCAEIGSYIVISAIGEEDTTLHRTTTTNMEECCPCDAPVGPCKSLTPAEIFGLSLSSFALLLLLCQVLIYHGCLPETRWLPCRRRATTAQPLHTAVAAAAPPPPQPAATNNASNNTSAAQSQQDQQDIELQFMDHVDSARADSSDNEE